MGTWTDHFIEGLPAREVSAIGPVTEINHQGPPASSDTHRGQMEFFFSRRHPETARVGFEDGESGAVPAGALSRRLRLARRRTPSTEEMREAVRQRINEQRRRFEREQEEALSRQGRPPVRRRKGSLFHENDDEHVVRELRPAGLRTEGPRLEAPTPAYEPPQAPVRNGSRLDISA